MGCPAAHRNWRLEAAFDGEISEGAGIASPRRQDLARLQQKARRDWQPLAIVPPDKCPARKGNRERRAVADCLNAGNRDFDGRRAIVIAES